MRVKHPHTARWWMLDKQLATRRDDGCALRLRYRVLNRPHPTFHTVDSRRLQSVLTNALTGGGLVAHRISQRLSLAPPSGGTLLVAY